MAKKENGSNASQFSDTKEITKFWKDTYLGGLETGLRLQEETEQMAIEATKQGLAAQGQLLNTFNHWMDTAGDQIPGVNGFQNPFLAWSKQYTQAVQSVVEPVLATTAKTYENAVQSYEKTFSKPFRSYVKEANKQVLDTVVSN